MEKIFIPDNNVFLKIDVQGYESQILEGAINILPKIKGIQTELSLVTLYEDQLLFDEMIDYIVRLRFELYDIFPGFRNKQTGRLLQVDAIFFHPI